MFNFWGKYRLSELKQGEDEKDQKRGKSILDCMRNKWVRFAIRTLPKTIFFGHNPLDSPLLMGNKRNEVSFWKYPFYN